MRVLLAVLALWAAWLGSRSLTAPPAEVRLPWVDVRPSLSRDGRLVAFAASRAAVAAGRAFGPRSEGEVTDVLLWDGERVVNATEGLPGRSYDPFVAPDGGEVAYVTEAGDRTVALFVRSRTGEVRRVEPPAPGSSFSPVLAAGRLAFLTTGTPRGERRSVVLLDPLRVLPGRPLGPALGRPALSPDGSLVAYACFRDWAVGDARRGTWDIRLSATGVEGPSRNLTGETADGPSYSPSLARGVCAFTSLASNLVPGDANGQFDVFVRDLEGDRVVRASEGLDEGSFEPSLSEDGRWLAFSSYGEGRPHVFLRDLRAGRSERIAPGYNPCLSGDGSTLAFASREEGGQVFVWRAGRLVRVPVR